MTESSSIVNLREDPVYIEQYVSLRNRYCEILLTNPLDLEETKKWLKASHDTEIRCIVFDNKLLGVAILYPEKNGEVAFFSDVPDRGIGSQLLQIIEQTARMRHLDKIWAWVLDDNHIAQRVFLKNGYLLAGESMREFRGVSVRGIVFQKLIIRGENNE